MKTTAFELKLAVLEYYRFGSQCVSVDEFNGADVVADTGKEIIETEVKLSKSDLRADRRKHKHGAYWAGHAYHRCHPNKFLFCVPMDLVEDAREMVAALNPKYGIIGFDTQAFETHVENHDFIPSLRNYLCVMKRAH